MCLCLHLPRVTFAASTPMLYLLTFSLILSLFFAWVGAVLWSCFLTLAARRVGEVRKRSAERVGRHPPRPAAVAAVMRGAQGPYGQAGECARVVRSVCGVCAGGAWWRSLESCPLATMRNCPGTVQSVARRYGVSRQAVHGWQGCYEPKELAGLADHTHRPRHQPASWMLRSGAVEHDCHIQTSRTKCRIRLCLPGR